MPFGKSVDENTRPANDGLFRFARESQRERCSEKECKRKRPRRKALWILKLDLSK